MNLTYLIPIRHRDTPKKKRRPGGRRLNFSYDLDAASTGLRANHFCLIYIRLKRLDDCLVAIGRVEQADICTKILDVGIGILDTNIKGGNSSLVARNI